MVFEARTLREELARLLHLAWPGVVGQLGIVALGVEDVIMSGRLGEGVLAATAIGNTWSFGILIVAIGALRGLDPIAAQAFGAGDQARLSRVLGQSTLLALLLSLPVMGLHLLAGPALTLLGQPAALIPDAAAYAAVLALSVAPLLAFGAISNLLQCMGVMRPTAVVQVAGNLLNILLNGVLMYGWLGGWELGAVGCGIATTLGRWAMPILLVVLTWERLWPLRPSLADLRRKGDLGKLLRLGLPVGLQYGGEVWAFNITGLMAGLLGATAIGAHTVALNLSSVSFMVPMGLGAAAATRVGNLVGAGLSWTRAGRVAVALGAGFMVCSAITMLALPGPLARLYSADPTIVAGVLTILPFAASFQLFDGIQAVSFGVLRGAGDTRVPALLNVVAYYMLGLPIAWWLGIHEGRGLPGIWTGLVVGLAVVAGLLLARIGWLDRHGVRPVA